MSEQKRSKPAGNQPITRHPLFPAIVALWFAALFGAGSIAIPPALIGRVVTTLGVDRALPMAAPPLGSTARVILALALTGFGAAIGSLAARALSRAEQDTPARRSSSVAKTAAKATAKDAAAAPAGRRRALAIVPPAPAEEAAPDTPKPPALADGGILSVAEFDLDGFDDTANGAASAQAAAEAETEAQAETPASPASASTGNLFESYARGITPSASMMPPLPAEPAETRGAAAETIAAPVAPSPPAPADTAARDTAPAHHGARAAERIAAAPLDELSPIELLERLALAMAARRAGVHGAEQAPVTNLAPEAVEIASEGQAAEPEAVAPAIAADDAAPPPFITPRLQSAQADAAGEPVFAAAPPPASMAEPGIQSIPAALRPVNFDDLADDALPAYIPPRHIGRTPSAIGFAALTDDEDEEPCGEEPDEDEDLTDEEGYSSLLSLSRPNSGRENPLQQFIAIEGDDPDGRDDMPAPFPSGEDTEPGPFAAPAPGTAAPAAPLQSERLFDAPGKPGPEETEEALRNALAALQRMSGAA